MEILTVLLLILFSVDIYRNLRPLTRSAYEKTLSSWTTNRKYVLVALLLYDKLGVKFSIEDDEPWFKKMVIRKNGNVVEEFHVEIIHRTLDEFEDRIWKIMKYGMPSIDCPPFSSTKELEMKLKLSTV